MSPNRSPRASTIRELAWDLREHASRVRHRAYDLYACRIRREPEGVTADELVTVTPEICTNLLAFSFSMSGWHYLTAVLREYADHPEVRYHQSVLRHFHDRYQPSDMSTLVGDDPNITFRPPVGILPWGSFDVALSKTGGCPKDVRQSRQFGPTDIRGVKWDFSQIRHLYGHVKTEGYRPFGHESGFISGVFLCRNNGERRFVLLDGTHRCAILSFLGQAVVTMRYAPGCHREIREDDVEDWYYVKRGLCSVSDALAYFHAYFEHNGLERARRLGLIGAQATLS